MKESPSSEAANPIGASELRTDVLSGQAVIIAPARSHRPGADLPAEGQHNSDTATSATASAEFQHDPFLEGREHLTPPELFAIRPAGSRPDSTGWSIRVVPNRFPAVNQPGADDTDPHPVDSLIPSRQICGSHEVVIECPDFRTRLHDLTDPEIHMMLRAWQARVRDLHQTPRTGWIAVFRNEGRAAGASLSHCHSQIMSVPFVPDEIQQRVERSTRHYERTGQCLTSDWLKTELDTGRGVLAQNDQLAVVCPFASVRAWQVRILLQSGTPPSFADCPDELLKAVGQQLSRIVRALDNIVPQFAFNLTLTMPPVDQPSAFPWILDLLPRTTGIAGFELLSGCDINPVPPEHAADRIRQVLSTI